MTQPVDLSTLFAAQDVQTFWGLPRCDDLALLNAPAAILGVPGATPYSGVGAYCRDAPGALRAAMAPMSANIDRHNFDLGGPTFPDGMPQPVDCGDLPFDAADFATNRRIIQKAVQQISAAGAVPVLLGGDDSVPIPMVQALADHGPLTILQIDAHIDWRHIHLEEPLGLSSTMRRASEMAHVERIVQVGARSIGSAHSDDLADAQAWGAQIVPAYDLHRAGVEQALESIPQGARIVICFDVDALDPSLVPGVIGRAPGGLSYFQVLDLFKGAASKGQIVAADIVEYMPGADVDGIGALNVSRLIAALLGLVTRQAAVFSD